MSILDLPPTPITAAPVILPGFSASLGITPTRRPVDPDFQESIDSGLTESFEDFCKRISQDTP